MLTSDMGYVELMAATEATDDPGYEVPATTEVVQVTARVSDAAADEYVVESTTTTDGLSTIPQLLTGQVTLLASTHDGAGQGALLAQLTPGQTIAIPTALAVGTGPDALEEGATIESLVSGVAQLVDGGSVVASPVGYLPRNSNAETMVGVSQSGDEATLIVIDKDSVSPGVTWQQAAQAALDLGVSDALLLDGGGSSTLVAQLPTPAVEQNGTTSRVTVVNTPANDGNFPEGAFTQRLVGNGLFFTGTATPAAAAPAPAPTATSATAPPVLPATGPDDVTAPTLIGAISVLTGVVLFYRGRHVEQKARRLRTSR